MNVNPMRIAALLCCILLPGLQAWAEGKEDHKSLTATYYVRTEMPDQLAQALITFSEGQGGRLVSLAQDRVQVLVPTNTKTEVIVKFLNGFGIVLSTEASSRHLGEDLAVTAAAIQSKEKHIKELTALFSDAGFDQTLELEQELLSATTELEGMKSTFRKLREQSGRMDVIVFLRANDVRRKDTLSPFPWVRRLDIENFLKEFREQ